MDSYLIISLSLLAGIATFGSVWYAWGLTENAVVVRKQLQARAEAHRLEEASEQELDEPDSDDAET